MLAFDLTTPSIPGTFTYTPPAGTIEPVGNDTLSVAFTPTDTTDYQPSTATVNLLVVNPVPPIVATTISWPTPAPITYGTPSERYATRRHRHGISSAHACYTH